MEEKESRVYRGADIRLRLDGLKRTTTVSSPVLSSVIPHIDATAAKYPSVCMSRERKRERVIYTYICTYMSRACLYPLSSFQDMTGYCQAVYKVGKVCHLLSIAL